MTSNVNHDNHLPDWAVGVEEEDETMNVAVDREQSSSPLAINGDGELARDNNEALPDWTVGDQAATNVDQTSLHGEEEAKGDKWDLRQMIKRDGRLLLITIAIVILINIPIVKWILYPFTLFSTWIHELCHGLAAILVGGHIAKLKVFPDTSGLAYTFIPSGRHKRAFVASAGYQGTAVVGCLLLLFRRTKRGPRTGIMTLGITMIVSTLVWIRNVFGFFIVVILGIALCVCGWKLPSQRMRDVYVSVAVTCTLNAITRVAELFGKSQYVNGQPSETDAHTMEDQLGVPFWFWALLWLLFALLMGFLGLIFAIPGPDEVADFECCGVCQDFGLFDWCNKRRNTEQ